MFNVSFTDYHVTKSFLIIYICVVDVFKDIRFKRIRIYRSMMTEKNFANELRKQKQSMFESFSSIICKIKRLEKYFDSFINVSLDYFQFSVYGWGDY